MSHRISIEIGSNEFLIEQADGGIYDTSIDRVYPLSAIFGAMSWELACHQENGFSSNCVICRDEARKSALALAERRAAIEMKISRAYNSCTGEQIVDGGTLAGYYGELIALAQPAPDAEPVDVEQMQARFATLEAALTDDLPRERADEIMTELVDLQFAIEKAHGAIDNQFDGRMMSRNLSDTY